jgi:hypothetical protein
MAHNVPLGPPTKRAPSKPGELRIGAQTAREIGWSK